jgi:hypothetical protein
MLWLLVIVLVGGMMFVMFHKPHVNNVVGGWTPPPLPPAQPSANPPTATIEAQSPVAPAIVETTFDLNDLYGRRPTPPNDQPRA